MLESLERYVGYANGASRSTQNLSSANWAIYGPNGELVSLQGIYIIHSTNKIAKYNAVIELMLFPMVSVV